VCDYLVVLAAAHVQVNGEIDDLLRSHHRLVGSRRDVDKLASSARIVEVSHTERQTTAVVASEDPILDPTWSVESLTLEDLVLAYMAQAEEQRREVVRSKVGWSPWPSSQRSRAHTYGVFTTA
jgi:ABC-2 type transport system ATP-binding protein